MGFWDRIDKFYEKRDLKKFVKRYGFEFVRDDRGAPEYIATEKTQKFPFLFQRKDGKVINAFFTCGAIFWPNKASMANTGTLRHELSHVEDHRKLGHSDYDFISNMFKKAFTDKENPFEVKARRAERRW